MEVLDPERVAPVIRVSRFHCRAGAPDTRQSVSLPLGRDCLERRASGDVQGFLVWRAEIRRGPCDRTCFPHVLRCAYTCFPEGL